MWCYRERLQATTCLQVCISKTIQCRCLPSLFPSDLIWMRPAGTTQPYLCRLGWGQGEKGLSGSMGRSQRLQILTTTSILAGGDQEGHLPNALGQDKVGQLRKGGQGAIWAVSRAISQPPLNPALLTVIWVLKAKSLF